MSIITNISDAVVELLNNETFSIAFTAERKILPDYELADLQDLRVSVVPKARDITGASRSISSNEFAVDVGIQKKLGSDFETEVPPLLALVDEICLYLSRRALPSMANVVWTGIKNEPVYAPEHLSEKRTFTSVLTVTYRVMT